MFDYTADVECPLRGKFVSPYECQAIAFAAEGRTPKDSVDPGINLERASEVCADCVHAYFNRRMEEHGPFNKG